MIIADSFLHSITKFCVLLCLCIVISLFIYAHCMNMYTSESTYHFLMKNFFKHLEKIGDICEQNRCKRKKKVFILKNST